MVKIDLTEQETKALVGLLDIATKAGGLSVVNSVAVLQQKIMSAVQAHEAELKQKLESATKAAEEKADE